MIAANDLRIGNLILHNKDIVKVTQIVNLNNRYCINGIGLNGYTHYGNVADYFEPIPLTEKILLDCGFEKQMAWTFRKHLIGNLYLVYYLGEKGWSIGNKNYSDFPCEHLHTLQNVIYDLSKTELIINL